MTSVKDEDDVARFEVGDGVVYAPHGAGKVIDTVHRDDAWGEYLSIQIIQSSLTLMVPAAAAEEKGVRAAISADDVEPLLAAMRAAPHELPENGIERGRLAADRIRTGDTDVLAGIVRDYAGRVRAGSKLTATELRTVTQAKAALASEIAVATDVDLDAALERLETAISPTED